MGSHFGVGEFTTHFRTNFSGDWDVHWRYGLLSNNQMNILCYLFSLVLKGISLFLAMFFLLVLKGTDYVCLFFLVGFKGNL